MVPFAYFFPGDVANYMLAIAFPIHNHMGFDAVLTDYLPNDTVRKAAWTINWSLGGATVAGLCHYNYTDIGVCAAMGKLWAL
jgi:succinate dehydrogenase (ubiquinone) membrane anchor subunit